MAETDFSHSSVVSIELLVRNDSSWAVHESVQREKIISDFLHIRPFLPTGLKHYTVRWPRLESKLQSRLDRVTCAACCHDAGSSWSVREPWPPEAHTCSGSLTPAVFEGLSWEEKLALVERSEKDARWTRVGGTGIRQSS